MATRTRASEVVPGFAERLAHTRTGYGKKIGDRDMHMGKFAAALGLEAETYRRYERGETEPSLAVLARVRDVTGVSLDYLVAGDVPTAA